MITDDQARPLAAFVNQLRPDWDVPGIRAALSNARHRAPASELAQALIRLTERVDLRTPAVLKEDGPHWPTAGVAHADVRFTRCDQPGHTSFPAWNCGACKADRVGVESQPVTLTIPPEQIALNAVGAALARAALATPLEET